MSDFLVLIYYAGSPLRMCRVEASCYADAVEIAAPGSDAVKIEVIAGRDIKEYKQ